MAISIMGIPTTHPVFQNKRIGSYFYRINASTISTLGVITPPPSEEIIRLHARDRLHIGYATTKNQQRQIEQDNIRIANEMLSFFNLHCPDDAEFNWLDSNDPRLCFYCWRLVFLSTTCNTTNNTIDISSQARAKIEMKSFIPFINSGVVKGYINQPPLTNQPRSAAEAKDAIIYYIDALNIDKGMKSQLISILANDAKIIMQEKSLIPWINKDDMEAHLSWVEHYLRENLKTKKILTSKDALIYEIQSFFDTLSACNKIEYRYHISAMKKAWSQKCFRDNRVGKKQYSFNMSNDISALLDELCKKEKLTKGELIEDMIRRKHRGE
jgi:hypothetical protein